MTIEEHDRVTTGRRRGKGDNGASLSGSHALVDLLNAGEPYAVAFGGQGGNWLENLEELISSAGIESELSEIVGEAQLLLEPVARELVVVRPIGFEPMQWVRTLAADEPLPTTKQLTTAAISGPGILLAQMAAIRAVTRQGLDLYGTPPVAMAGHSQGIMACESLKAQGAKDAELLALLQLIGAAGSLVSRRRGMVGRGDKSPMVSVTNVDPDRMAELLEDFSTDVRTVLPPILSIRNGRRSVVITGTPEQLARFELYCSKITEKEEAERKNKLRGGAVFSPVFAGVQVEVGFHTPRLADGVGLVERWAAQIGIDADMAHEMTESIFVRPIDWVAEVDRLHDAGARWIVDLGPSDTVTRLTAPVIRGLGIGIVPAATRAGQRSLFTVGAVPEIAAPWTSYAPSTVQLPDGSVKLSTKFTRLTGRSPILLAGMTPTTVDAKIVAAAANAGHWAELAGGGQVTEPIFDARIEELTALLEPGRAIQFNTLFLDPYLWKLQVGGKRLVQKARQSGAPIDGLVVSAGIPELEEAVGIIEELNSIGISHVCFKPGTVEQIKSVIKIAEEVGDSAVIVHIEGGRAGGHHSWEDLDDLLVSTYGELRKCANITVCVGGGIGTPERAAEYLSGRWSARYGFPIMPVDGILVGTAAMATLEATTSPAVKQLLVDTNGTDQWVGAGKAQGGMASGRSQLGADIHEIDNAASRCGRLLDEVAGDADAVAEKRDEIIAAMAVTAKPYFGDIAEMNYLQWLQRYVELAIGDGDSTADTKKDGSPWLDVSWRDRFQEMLQRAEARLHPSDSGPVETIYGADAEGEALLEDPQRAIEALLARYPDAGAIQLHPADVPFFITLCKTLGKPVNFVPVIDKDVRRWWRSDSLWQAHDARYTADEVCVIPGTEAVVGITRVDEPVGELLDRFEQASIDEVVATGAQPVAVVSRRQARADVKGPLAVVLDSPDVLWAGRTAINPVHRIGEPGEWQVNENRSATHPSTGARLELSGDGVILNVPLSNIWITINFTLPKATVDGGMPVVTTEDASAAMRAVLAIATGVDGPDALPTVVDDSTTVTVAWDPEEVADHTGVTATFGAPLAPGLTLVPDALVGKCWPAVFAVIGAAVTDTGFPVVEGLLSLVHLDHAAHLLAPMPKSAVELTVTATASAAVDTEYGRVVPVTVSIRDESGTELAVLQERFAIRGRTGAVELTDPPRAGGAITDNATDTPRRRRRDVTVTAPTDMSAFAVVSGDHNPIHTDRAAALLAGLKSPIVHGMWLSAAAQHAVTATDGQATPPARLVGWTSRFLGMVLPGDEIEFRVDRVGIDRGAEIVEVTAKVDNDLVMSATAQLAAPKTVYAFPGQGIQSKGMGMDVRARSKAARKVWDQRRQVHARHAGLLGAARGARQPDQPDRQRRALPAPRGRAVPDAVHPGRDGDRRRSPGRRDARAGCVRRGRHRLRALRRRVHGAGLRVRRVPDRGAAGDGVPPRQQDARHRAARRARPVELPPRRHPALADRSRRRRRPVLRRRDRRAHGRIPADRELQPAWFAVRDRRHGARPRGARGRSREAPRALRWQALVHPGARHRRAVPLLGAPGGCRGLPSVTRTRDAARRRSGAAGREVHPEPGATAVHPGPRLHPGDPRPGARGAARRDPGRLRHLAQREAAGAVPQGRHRAAGMAVRQPRAVDRDAGPAVHRGGRRRSRHRAVRRDRREERADRRGPRDQHAEAAGVLAQHHRGAQRRA